MELFDLIKKEDILLDISPGNKEDIIKEMVARLAKNNGYGSKTEELQKQVLARENIGTTAIGRGLAVPHVKSDIVSGIHACLTYFPEGVEFKSLDGNKTKVVFLVIAPPDMADEYLKILAQATRVLKDAQNQRILFAPKDRSEILGVLKKVCTT